MYVFGTGPIKGFATTLIIGIITSLFAAIFLTRLVFESRISSKKKISFSSKITEGWFKNTSIKFLDKRKFSYLFSGLVVILGLFSLLTRGLNQGVDFVGGRTFVVRFDNDIVTQDIRSALADPFETAPEVKTFGRTNQVKITTKYLINSKDSDDLVNEKLNQGLSKLNSNFQIIKSLLPNMLSQKYGKIIGISSIVGSTGNPGQANYVASKSGMVGLYKSIALEVAKRKINVNVVSPGFIFPSLLISADGLFSLLPSKIIATVNTTSKIFNNPSALTSPDISLYSDISHEPK